MQKDYSLANSLMQIVQSTNFISSIGLLIFLVYSIFGLHSGKIEIGGAILMVVATLIVWGLVLKIVPILYPALPIAIELIWHGNSISDMNLATMIASFIFLVVMLVNHLLAFIAVKNGYLDLR